MKNWAVFLASLVLLTVLGCSGLDKDRATQPTGSMPSFTTASAGSAGAGSEDANAKQYPQSDAESNGGHMLQASAPYEGKGTPVSQNLNPAPFMNASQPVAGKQSGEPSSELVSRADGTMYGPGDHAAAGAGPGMEGAAMGGAYPSKSISGAGTKSGAGKAPGKPASKPASPK